MKYDFVKKCVFCKAEFTFEEYENLEKTDYGGVICKCRAIDPFVNKSVEIE